MEEELPGIQDGVGQPAYPFEILVQSQIPVGFKGTVRDSKTNKLLLAESLGPDEQDPRLTRISLTGEAAPEGPTQPQSGKEQDNGSAREASTAAGQAD
jgi:hypothetical protein